jgi:predicted RNA binding protein YcfA (HicA-like mRNA interferase family)
MQKAAEVYNFFVSQWPSSKAKRVYQALVRIGWTPKAQTSGSSHLKLQREGYRSVTWAWHDSEELGPAALRRIAKYTGLTPEDL